MSNNREMPDIGWQFKSKEHGGWLDTLYENLLDLMHNGYEIRQIAAPAEDVRATRPISKEKEQAAFEKWLIRNCPSGDCESVHAQWLESSDYEDLLELEAVPAVVDEPEIVAMVESALRRSFSLGQVFWQQADSDSTCQQNKSDQTLETQAVHISMLVESIRKELNRHPQRPVVMPERRQLDGWLDCTSQDRGWNACLDEFARLNK